MGPAGLPGWYQIGDFCVVRSPLLPVERLPDAGAGRAEVAEAIRSALADSSFRSALFFASPELDATLSHLSATADSPPKLQRSLLRYFFRAATRETPFGLFAGHSVGRIGTEDCFALAARDRYRTHTRLSMAFLNQFMTAVSSMPEVRDDVPHEPNSSLVPVQGNYRMALDELVTPGGHMPIASSVTEITRTPAIDRVLELCQGGASLSSIARAMVGTNLEFRDLLEFCRALGKERILVPRCLPTVTGSDRARACAKLLKGHPRLDQARSLLADTTAALEEADRSAVDSAEPYRAARARLLEGPFSVATLQPLQTELVKPAPQLTISEALAHRFLAAAELLQRVAPTHFDPALDTFRRRFVARYEQRLVPLAEALDGDLGIGFGGTETHMADSLVAGLPLAESRETAQTFGESDRARLRLLERALATGSQVVELDSDALELFPKSEAGEPEAESFSVMARLARSDDGRLLIIAPELTQPSAVALLARFCEVDSELQASVTRLAEQEQKVAGETILADVAYCPTDDSANVVTRPVLRDYEIECGGGSAAPTDRKLAISDLFVGVEDGEVRLYSQRLRKRVAVRIGNAHNYDRTSLPTLYRFLGALQHQSSGLASGWAWGALEAASFLPRVVCGDVVLSLARWEISKSEWATVLAAKPEERMDRIRELRLARSLPRWLTRSEGDRRLIVDLDNELSVDELVHEAQHQGTLVLDELLPRHDQLVLRGPEGSYAAQFVLPFVRRVPLRSDPLPAELHATLSIARCRPPGSDWLYARVYAGRSRHREILRELAAKVVSPSLGSAATLWFYLPFADPEPHIRIRFEGSPAELRNTVLSRLERALDPMLASGKVFRFELGTYDPEFERYGGPGGTALAHQIFFADSEAANRLLELAGDDHELRWQLTLLGIDRLLGDCGAGLEQRADLARIASEQYGREASADTATWKAIGDRYRKYSQVLSRLLWESSATDELVVEARRVLAARTLRVRPVWTEIERQSNVGALATRSELLPLTFAHLHAVRMLGVTGRTHELVLYEFLRRQYAARRSTTRQETHDTAAHSG